MVCGNEKTFHTSRMVMGDVSGKGVPAALLMGVIHGAVRSSLWSESSLLHESESQELNRLLCESASTERFASNVLVLSRSHCLFAQLCECGTLPTAFGSQERWRSGNIILASGRAGARDSTGSRI
jgi:hypothetical protein